MGDGNGQRRKSTHWKICGKRIQSEYNQTIDSAVKTRSPGGKERKGGCQSSGLFTFYSFEDRGGSGFQPSSSTLGTAMGGRLYRNTLYTDTFYVQDSCAQKARDAVDFGGLREDSVDAATGRLNLRY